MRRSHPVGLGRRHPEVGAASVEDNLELLGRCTNCNGAEIYMKLAAIKRWGGEMLTLRIQEVLHGDIVAVFGMDRGVSEDIFRCAAHGFLGIFVA